MNGRTPAGAVPAEYLRAVPAHLQGALKEVSYPVRHYINKDRKLVVDPRTDARSAGRETVQGEPLAKPCNVYLPAGYDPDDPAVRYPVLYLLHGVGGDHFEWIRGSGTEDGRSVILNIIDNLIAGGEIEPLIFVFPNGRSAWNWQDATFDFAGTNMLGFYYFDYELRHDLIPFIEANFHTRATTGDKSPQEIEADRRERAIAGLSMGGMQVLNLVLGGFRHDAAAHVDPAKGKDDGLLATVPAPGMLDLFGRAGAFSNAPTSAEGHVLGASVKASGYPLHLLYMNCGDADDISHHVFRRSVEGLAEHAGEALVRFCRTVIEGGVHDFRVWNSGAFHFLRNAFPKGGAQSAGAER